MTALAMTEGRIAAMSESALANVRSIEGAMLQLPQVQMPVHHIIHGGMYLRTLTIPAGVAITGAFIRVPTALIVCGNVTVYANDQTYEIDGYQVLAGSAGRKQVFVAHSETTMTAMFATSAKTVAEAEEEFTSEAHLLASRGHESINTTLITGE